MNIVIDTIEKHISSRNVRFVFPSQIAARLWAQKTCTLGIAGSVASDRFLAWDRFKEEVTEEKLKTPVSDVIRKLFAESLVRKNAEEAERGTPFLKSVIPPEYSKNGGIFASYIAGFLPHLASWEKLFSRNSGDSEDLDLLKIKNEYALFLDRFDLFEPSWEEIRIDRGSVSYLIFFPELIEDFSEYEKLLCAPGFTKIGANEVAGGQTLTLFQSVRDEIRSAAMEMQRLHEEGVPYGDMAVSVPELEEMEPCLVKEFYLRHIPVARRAGKPLGGTGAGRLFRLINDCASSRYSFNSIKALVLNDHIPWKDRQKNHDLVMFGIEYNCVCGYVEGGKSRDIWEEAFGEARNAGFAPGRYYRELKKHIEALKNSRSFTDIRKHYFAFRGQGRGFLDMDLISEEDNAILSRCIEELSSLIELEERFNDSALVPSSPFDFFILCLEQKEYVRANLKPGVNIFKWRVAAASPYRCHFVLNASQGASTVLYQPMKFLRADKRKILGLDDSDATGAFFTLCDTGDSLNFRTYTRISASSRTFSGWAIPHSFFANGKTVEASGNGKSVMAYEGSAVQCEPYELERRFWKEGVKRNAAPLTIYPLQKLAFENWKKGFANVKKSFSFFSSPVPDKSAVKALLEKALPRTDGNLTVTPTLDLNVFYDCPVSWLYRRIFKASEISLEAALLDDTALGALYHRILEALFGKIKNEDSAFNSAKTGDYAQWALEITKDTIKKESAFKGPLAAPIVLPQAAGMAKKIAALLLNEARHFDNYTIAELELPVSCKTGDFTIRGIIDRVSVSPEGDPVILDYKTNYLPRQIKQDELGNTPLTEFQAPLYIKLYEDKLKESGKSILVEGAVFYNITGREMQIVVGKRTRSNSATLDREEYSVFLDAAQKWIEEFGRRAVNFDLVPDKINYTKCVKCACKTACRSTYFLNSSHNGMASVKT